MAGDKQSLPNISEGPVVVGHVTQEQADRVFSKKVEKERFRVVTKARKLKFTNRYTGAVLLAMVTAICILLNLL